MPPPEPFPILHSADLERAARSCPLLQGRAAEEWIACCSKRFFRVARSIVGDDAFAQDVMQESWIKIMQSVQYYKGGPPACPWVRAIISNTARDVRRARLRAREAPLSEDDAADPTQSLETQAEQEQMLRLLREMITILPKMCRKVAVSRIYHNLSVKETSERLQISQADVSIRLHRAVELLKKRLDARLQSPPPPDKPAAGSAKRKSPRRKKSSKKV